MAQTAQANPVVTGQQLIGASPQQRQALLASLSPDDQSRVLGEYEGLRSDNNRQYLHMAFRKIAPAYVNGGGVTQTFAQGATLKWDMPTAGGAYASALVFTCALTITLAAGASAVYGLGVAGPLGIFSQLSVTLNGVQHQIPPYIIKYLSALSGVGRSVQPSTVYAGTKDTTIENKLNNGGTYGVATGANTWNFKFRVPLNAIARTNPAGLLPIMNSATKPQVSLIVNSNLVGNDPEQNGIYAVSGTGHAVTSVAGTIQMDVEYYDGQTFWSPQALSLDLNGEPTVQYITDNVMNNIAAGSVQRCRISSLFQHYAVIAVYMDGTTAGKFVSGLSNIARIEMAMDSVGQNVFQAFGTGTNLDIYDFYERLRDLYGQDFDEGVIPWVLAGGRGINNVDNQDGIQVLNMTPGGWPDVVHGVQFTAVGSVYTPRIATYLVSLNPAGLKLVNLS
jgi:hypothetical protein